jgi:hypothetical protein
MNGLEVSLTQPFIIAGYNDTNIRKVEYGGQCFASSSVNFTLATNQSLSDCSMLCSDTSLEYCGGPNRIQLYKYNGTDPLASAP